VYILAAVAQKVNRKILVSPRRSYRSFLIRCWTTGVSPSSDAADERFVVESVTDAPRHWIFASFEDLIAFLRAQLLAPLDEAEHERQGQSDE
jgi:hypothetical protein